jgi:imidazolonepropionase-like amidohydrolase
VSAGGEVVTRWDPIRNRSGYSVSLWVAALVAACSSSAGPSAEPVGSNPAAAVATTAPGLGTATTAASTVSSATAAVPGDRADDIVVLGRVIDGTGGPPIADGAVVIRGDTILAVGARPDLDLPTDAQVYDIPGTTILPGFINAHVHNAYDLSALQAWAAAGVTTVRDLGARWNGSFDYYFWLRDRLATFPKAARLIAAGPLVTVPGGYPIAGNNFDSLVVTSPEDARAQIRRLLDAGADVIKITLTVEAPPTLTLAEASAIVEMAHRRGIPVTVHLTTPASLARALAAGVDDIAHSVGGFGSHLSDDLIQRMVEEDVSWVSTQAIQEGEGADNLLRFVEAGGRVAMGNDAGFLSGVIVGMPMNEIRALRAAGLTPMQIIVASTRNAAYVCRIDDLVGTLEVGKIADLLVVYGDPLADLEVLADVALVIHNGVVIRQGG